ncbi:hypothetical protein EGW08_000740 [Elysia chlorotica]|uniref:FZ domain-containing protein n=1 Tax=Elysia chlorotica TaxID=188477 RepID=A0A433UCJ6_ELYCH|nr:hypothetical protein EGW08_000740 [Elysia chlorotica]
MEIVNFTFLLSILFTAIPVLHSLTYDECSLSSEQCMSRFNAMSSGSNDLCREGIVAVNCVRLLDCPSMMYKLMSFRQVLRKLYNAGVVRCELGSFLQDFPFECANSQDLRTCVVTYTDRIIAHTSRGIVDKEAACQDMNDYVTCQLDWDGQPCNVTKETLSFFMTREKTRMAITDCDLPGLNSAPLSGHVSILVLALTVMLSFLLAPGSSGRV